MAVNTHRLQTKNFDISFMDEIIPPDQQYPLPAAVARHQELYGITQIQKDLIESILNQIEVFDVCEYEDELTETSSLRFLFQSTKCHTILLEGTF